MGIERQQRFARKAARQNGRLLLYLATPLWLIAPVISAGPFRWWHVPLCCACAVGNVFLCRAVIRWGQGSTRRT